MSYKSHAMREFKAAGWLNEDDTFKDEMQEMICNHVFKLLDVFSDEGHSGSSAPYAINLFTKLASWKPIAPLTGEDWEWADVSESSGRTLYQNKRLSSVFKEGEDGIAYNIDGKVFWEWFKGEDGDVFKSYFTSRDSRVNITFPYEVPERPEYVFLPTAEFPNEVL